MSHDLAFGLDRIETGVMVGDLRYLMMKAEWYNFDYQHKEADELVRPFLACPIEVGWLKRVREALFLSVESVAIRAQVSNSTYFGFESGEERINIRNLRKCAEAMDCELVYAILPKEKTLFSERIWRKLDENAPNLDWIRIRQYNPHYRHMFGWRPNHGPIDPEVRRMNESRRIRHNVITDRLVPSLRREDLEARRLLEGLFWGSLRRSASLDVDEQAADD
jgi:transcriptional regulator with XRE-family HTH domain